MCGGDFFLVIIIIIAIIRKSLVPKKHNHFLFPLHKPSSPSLLWFLLFSPKHSPSIIISLAQSQHHLTSSPSHILLFLFCPSLPPLLLLSMFGEELKTLAAAEAFLRSPQHRLKGVEPPDGCKLFFSCRLSNCSSSLDSQFFLSSSEEQQPHQVRPMHDLHTSFCF